LPFQFVAEKESLFAFDIRTNSVCSALETKSNFYNSQQTQQQRIVIQTKNVGNSARGQQTRKQPLDCNAKTSSTLVMAKKQWQANTLLDNFSSRRNMARNLNAARLVSTLFVTQFNSYEETQFSPVFSKGKTCA